MHSQAVRLVWLVIISGLVLWVLLMSGEMVACKAHCSWNLRYAGEAAAPRVDRRDKNGANLG